jgi:hypothetical protein
MIHIFAEAQLGTPLGLNSSNEAFASTSLSKFTSFSFGLSFGRKRY